MLINKLYNMTIITCYYRMAISYNQHQLGYVMDKILCLKNNKYQRNTKNNNLGYLTNQMNIIFIISYSTIINKLCYFFIFQN